MQNLKNDKANYPALLSDERGSSATGLALLVTAASIVFYLTHGQSYIKMTYPAYVNTTILVTLAVMALFALGCAVHMMCLGDRSNREVRQELRNQVKELDSLCADASNHINRLESEMTKNVRSVGPRGIDCLGISRRLVRALDRRISDINNLLATRNKLDLIDAHDLLGKKLIINESCIDALIDADPIPPLALAELEPAFERLFREVEADTRQIA